MEDRGYDLGRREHIRVEVDAYISATLTTDKAAGERIFTTRDISPEGIFLASTEAFPIGTILNLKVHTPTTLEPINLEARVVRIAKDENSRVSGMGLIFSKISQSDKKELLKHLYLAYHYTEIK